MKARSIGALATPALVSGGWVTVVGVNVSAELVGEPGAGDSRVGVAEGAAAGVTAGVITAGVAIEEPSEDVSAKSALPSAA